MFFDKTRRKKPRFSINLDGYYKVDNEWEKCRFFDLNLEGAGLKINNTFRKDDVLEVKFDVDDKPDNDVVFKIIVVNNRDKRFGIKFINLNTSRLEFLKKIINAHSDRYKI